MCSFRFDPTESNWDNLLKHGRYTLSIQDFETSKEYEEPSCAADVETISIRSLLPVSRSESSSYVRQ